MSLNLELLFVISWPNLDISSSRTGGIAVREILDLPLFVGFAPFSVDVLPDAVLVIEDDGPALPGRLALGQVSRSHTLVSEQQPLKPLASQTNHWYGGSQVLSLGWKCIVGGFRDSAGWPVSSRAKVR